MSCGRSSCITRWLHAQDEELSCWSKDCVEESVAGALLRQQEAVLQEGASLQEFLSMGKEL